MQNQENNSSRAISLRIIMPDAEMISLVCDSLRLPVKDDENGRGGGLYGIHYGHAEAVISLDNGKIEVVKDGEIILRGTCSGGFARIEHSEVRLVCEHFAKE